MELKFVFESKSITDKISSMILYTAQPLFVYDRLMQGETWTASPFEQRESNPTSTSSNNHFELAYDWLCEQMRSKGICPSSEATKYPIWAYHHWNGAKKKKPDLRYESLRCFARSGTQVLMTLEVPDDRVLLSDYDAWHWVLNQWFLGSQSSDDDFERRCEEAGSGNRRFDKLEDIRFKAEIIESWQTIFDIQKCTEILEINPGENTTQAVFWELNPQDVREAVKFSVRGKTEKLRIPTGASSATSPYRHRW